MLCAHRHVLGKPGEGVHRFRIAGVAAVDLGLTVAVAWLISTYWRLAFWKVLAVLLLLGVLAHRLFCVDTAVDRWLFG